MADPWDLGAVGQARKADVKCEKDGERPAWRVGPVTVRIAFGCVRHSRDTAPESLQGASGVALNPLSLFALACARVFVRAERRPNFRTAFFWQLFGLRIKSQ